MIAPRLLGLGMMVIQAFLLWRSVGKLPVALAFLALAAAGCWPRLHRSWPAPWWRGVDAAIAVSFAIWWILWLQGEPAWSDQYGPNVLVAVGHGCIALQAARFYRRVPDGPGWLFPILGVLSLTCAGDRYLGGTEERYYFWGAMLHGALVAMFYTAPVGGRTRPVPAWRVYRYAVIALCLLLSFLLAAGTALALGRSDSLLQPWMARVLGPMKRIAPNNNEMTMLGSMADFDGKERDRIALQIVADESPGYLRGQVYADYENTRWTALRRTTNVAPATAVPAGYSAALPGEALFPVTDGGGTSGEMTVYPDAAIQTALFAPQETGWVGYAGSAIRTNNAGVVEAAQPLNGKPYRALAASPSAPVPLAESEVERYTRLPEALAPRIRDLSEAVVGERETAPGKALAVTQYFTGNYDYSLDFRAEGNKDPLEVFLFSAPHPSAHCEYFATGATLLLRAAGVPARYVTGVGVWEQHPYAAYWIARNRDAHAWCEAWDPEAGWFVVEATPASGLPEAAGESGASRLREFWSMAVFQVKRLIDALRAGAWPVVLAAVAALPGLLQAYWLPALVLAAVGALAIWWWRRRRTRKRRAAPDPEGVLERRLVVQLTLMDRHLTSKHRLIRPDSRTLHGFARDIETQLAPEDAPDRLAGWYRQWAEVRYRPRPDAAQVERLEETLASLQKRN